MRRILVFLVVSLILSTQAFSECTTTVSGTLDGEIWTLEGSPYCVEGDITAKNLTIEPGVRVEFSGNYVLSVTGVLTAVGTADFPIVFTKATESSGWQGILFDHTPKGSQLKYCRVEYSLNGGLRISDSVQTIENCTFSNNQSTNPGAGISISMASSSNELILKNCTISSNTATNHGGGVYIDSAAIISMEDCYITGNHTTTSVDAEYYGGGIYVASTGQQLILDRCVIADNQAYSRDTSGSYDDATSRGGGIYISKGTCLIKTSKINSNRAYASASDKRTALGGGIYLNQGTVEIVNTIISSNSCSGTYSEKGSGVFTASGTISIVNSTVAYNNAEGVRNDNGTVSAVNTIFYNNSGGEILGAAWIDYSLVKGGYATGTGIIDCNPRFISITDLRIRPDSCCVDAGDSYYMEDVCFCDEYSLASFGTSANDIGAHGGPGACGWCALAGGCCTPQPVGDLDEDGDIDAVDLAIFSGNYGQ